MRIKKHILLLLLTFLCAKSAAEPLFAQDVKIDLLKGDQHAIRVMKIFKKSSEEIHGLISIQSFDPASNSFILEGVSGEKKEVSASDIDKLIFEQNVREQPMQEQSQHWEITKTLGSVVQYKIPQNEFSIISGILTLKPSWEIKSTNTSETIPSQLNPPQDISVLEAKSIRYDLSSRSFLVDTQYVTYLKKYFGGGGSSGLTKGIR